MRTLTTTMLALTLVGCADFVDEAPDPEPELNGHRVATVLDVARRGGATAIATDRAELLRRREHDEIPIVSI